MGLFTGLAFASRYFQEMENELGAESILCAWSWLAALLPKSSIITFGFELDDISGLKLTDDHSCVAAVLYRKGN